MADIRNYSTTASSNTDIAPEGMAPSGVNDAIRTVQGELAQIITDDSGTLTTAGTSTAYTLTLSTAPSVLADGLKFSCTFDEANTGNSTLVVTPAGGAAFASKKIKKFVGSAEVEIVPGDIGANAHHEIEYDSAADSGTGAFILKNPMYPQAIARIVPTSNVAQADITVPTSISHLRITGVIFNDGASAGLFSMRGSTNNGTSYNAGASDYSFAQFFQTGATTGGSANANATVAYLAASHAITTLPAHFNATFHKGTAGAVATPSWHSEWGSYNAGNSNGDFSGFFNFAGPMTNLRFLWTVGNIKTGSVILVEAI